MAETPLSLASQLQLIDEMYARYRLSPESVDESWRRAFADGADGAQGAIPVLDLQAYAGARAGAVPAPAPFVDGTRAQEATALVHAYRVRGHLEATLDPLGTYRREAYPELDPKSHGFTEGDRDRLVSPGGLVGAAPQPLSQLVEHLRATYCGTIGVEFMHISAPERRRWLQERMEPQKNRALLDTATRRFILDQLIAATQMERFIDAKYVGAKRFSLEGSETLLPLLHLVLDHAGEHGVVEVVLGMAHRGRLNVLVNLLGMSAETLFAEFEDIDPKSALGGGDVKYHLGFSSDHVTRSGHQMHLSLSFNPSHLEAVDPVVVGRVRAKQRRRQDGQHRKVMGILIHGDAAFAGQGLVPETLNLADLRGYRTGGTVHIIVNNQIGFTTSPTEARSTPYCTDLAKGFQMPIFHVNGDDPDAVAHVAAVALDYRREFQSDVLIDMFCFRRHGHNEIDEPSFTQPLLYQRIRNHPDVHETYGAQLIRAGVVTQREIDEQVQAHHQRMSAGLERARSLAVRPGVDAFGGVWHGYMGGPARAVPDPDTRVPRERLAEIAERITHIPEGVNAHPKVVRLMEQRADMGRGKRPIDWAMAELLAFASLVWEGRKVRLTGQDVRRGTFSQRHATVLDIKTGAEYFPLDHLHPKQGKFRIYDSSLSEAAVLGFEFGYSLDWPDGLILWEAQFGDFANGAQVIIDQFVSSSEDRWKRLSGLVMLLPHGYEGQGPEHSSARIERYLQLSAEDNWQICQPTTPAQYFHLLRRQVLRPWRKPLVVMTPKSMLRLPAATSTLDELAGGAFQRILPDPETPAPESVRRVLLCTGKVFYELAEERRLRGARDVAILRVEQLYPLWEDLLLQSLEQYSRAEEIVFVQEEPANMGAWSFIYRRMQPLIERNGQGARRLRLVGRAESASPATGSGKAHLLEQRALLDEAFAR
jgi:2-oxoglutarate dehydrogenase E1 component